MIALSKSLGRDGEHKTRLHTRRGELKLAGLAQALWARHSTPASPWMAPAAVHFLARCLNSDTVLVELGSGVSTAWYAQRCGSVVSVEPNAEWAAKSRQALRHYDNASLIHSDVATSVSMLPEWFDVLVVDQDDTNEHNRVDSIREFRDRTRRMIVLDDSDRVNYKAADELLASWERVRFVGYRPRPLYPTETTVWMRTDA